MAAVLSLGVALPAAMVQSRGNFSWKGVAVLATDKSSPAGSCLAILLDDSPPRAAAFIVTIYGDVVEPRGGATWIGNLIEICAAVGISETLVRTAVSRLVSAGQL